MSNQVGSKSLPRVFYLDNLRIYLTILVILHHASLAYGGLGNWGIRDPSVNVINPILVMFNAVNQTYFMSAFFLLAGYFTPRSFEKKGVRQFLKDRLIRLGIPLIIYSIIVANVNRYLLFNFAWDQQVSLWTLIKENAIQKYSPDHLWFVQALLVFAVIYVLYRVLMNHVMPNKTFHIYRDRFPSDKMIWLWIGILSILMFLEHLVFPVGEAIILNFQTGFFVHYTFCFFCGVVAYRGNWLQRLESKQARRWGWMALGGILLFPVILAVGGVLDSEENFAKFEGGPYWQAFIGSIWLTFMMMGVIVFLLYFFRERFNQAGSLTKSMAANVYTVYIIHATVLFALNALFLSVEIPPLLKFILVSLMAVPLCFFLSSLIQRIPYAHQVLG